MRTRSYVAALTLLLSTAPLTAVAAPIAGAAAQVPADRESVSATDKADDVRIFRKAKGLPRAQRTSIDLRRMDIETRGSSVRFAVRLREILDTRAFDQMVFVRLAPAAGSSDSGIGEIGMSAQRPGLSYANLDTDGTGMSYETCDPLRARVHRRAATILLDVPVRCIPTGEVTIKVTSLTGYFRSDAGSWSQDRLRFGSPVVLR